jgi:hypothetical protein
LISKMFRTEEQMICLGRRIMLSREITLIFIIRIRKRIEVKKRSMKERDKGRGKESMKERGKDKERLREKKILKENDRDKEKERWIEMEIEIMIEIETMEEIMNKKEEGNKQKIPIVKMSMKKGRIIIEEIKAIREILNKIYIKIRRALGISNEKEIIKETSSLGISLEIKTLIGIKRFQKRIKTQSRMNHIKTLRSSLIKYLNINFLF